MDPIIVFLIIVVIVVVVVGVLVMNVIRAVQNLRRAAGSQAAQMVGKLAEELLSGNADGISIDLTSQEPRSISDMISVYAPAIAKDFPDLNIRQLISSAENKLYAALYAISEGTAAQAGDRAATGDFSSDEEIVPGEDKIKDDFFLGATPDFAAQIQRQIDSLIQSDRTEHFERIKIHRSGIHLYQKNAGTCAITLQTAIEYLHYIKQNGVVISGSQQVPEQARYNISLIYVQDMSRLSSSSTNAVGVTCPNCGAPVRGLGHRQCEYCGSAIQAIDMRIWRINQFTLS